MSLFNNKRSAAYQNGAFNSRRSSFDYFYIVEGRSIEDATRMADIIVQARGVPDEPPKPLTLIEKAQVLIKQSAELASENPKIAEFLIGLISGAASSLAGVAVGQQNAPWASQREDINRNTLPIDIEDA